MTFTPQAQAGQDIFCHALIPGVGKFIDIGAGDPIVLNNTYALEQIGWTGIVLEGNTTYRERLQKARKAVVLSVDATLIDWTPWRMELGRVVDFVSVDVDEHSFIALAQLFLGGFQPKVLTVEHDFYCRGDRLRKPIRELMEVQGYDLLCADVRSWNADFEDWFVDPKAVDMKVAEKFRSVGLDWKDVLKQGGAL